VHPGGNRTLAEPFNFKYGRIPEEFTKPRKRKTIVGVGIELTAADPTGADVGLFVVQDTTPGGPAARAGVRPLDRVMAINGALNDAGGLICGGWIGFRL
jgi:peptidylprolyl isomerase